MISCISRILLGIKTFNRYYLLDVILLVTPNLTMVLFHLGNHLTQVMFPVHQLRL